ncbi:MAG: multidrug ABC transporter permease, partial [Micavibrio aeruginosavorus]
MKQIDFISTDVILKPREIPAINFIGLKTLIGKEVGRFLNVYSQTIIAPLVTTMLYYAVFALAFGGDARIVDGLPYMTFLAPGLIMMTMVQNAFANTSSSLIIAKIQGNIVDILMPPISPGEFFTGFLIGGVLRGLMVGVVCSLAVWAVVGIEIHALWAVVAYAVLGNALLAILGIAGGIWSDKFDHIAAVTNFIVTPMTFLSGTFYSAQQLPGFWQTLVHYNPFFYMIDGFRYGFTGHADGNLMVGLLLLSTLVLLLG